MPAIRGSDPKIPAAPPSALREAAGTLLCGSWKHHGLYAGEQTKRAAQELLVQDEEALDKAAWAAMLALAIMQHFCSIPRLAASQFLLDRAPVLVKVAFTNCCKCI